MLLIISLTKMEGSTAEGLEGEIETLHFHALNLTTLGLQP